MQSGRIYGWIALLVFLSISFPWGKASPAQSADSSGKINGLVRDPAGAPISGAEARLTEVQSGAVRKAQAGQDGVFMFQDVPSGDYRIELVARCFRTLRKADIKIAPGSQLRLELDMPLCGGPDYRPATTEKFWTHAERKAATEEEKKLIELAEALPCEKHWLAKDYLGGRTANRCLNKETVEYHFAWVESFKRKPGSDKPEVSASANYEASVQFDKVNRQWIVTLHLSSGYACGIVCGETTVLSCQVYFDEQHEFIRIIEGTECDCGFIS